MALTFLLIPAWGFAAQSDSTVRPTAATSVGSGEASIQSDAKPVAFLPETTFTFSPVLDGAEVSHDFVIQNKGTAVLEIAQVKTA